MAATFTFLIGLFNETNPYKWMEGITIYAGVLFISMFAAFNDYVQEK